MERINKVNMWEVSRTSLQGSHKGWEDSPDSIMLAVKEEGPECEPRTEAKKSRHGGVCLRSLSCGGGDQWLSGAHWPISPAESEGSR